MASGVNKVILVGNLGNDPDVVAIETNLKKATFRMATTESYRNREGQRVDQTEWHTITVWRGLAEVVEKYLHKGSKVYVEGRLRTREYTDKEGIKKYFTEVLCDSLVMLDRVDSNTNGGTNAASSTVTQNTSTPQNTDTPPEENPEDDLPF
ncbi:MAG: single-stranded DNA-binding protein [Bacteroidales bacterium]|nr:single-stranded DNA-binding protein [Bacteroidales bacterium]MDD2323945.1 single-stranded DNA-binding protein [Bacteroidales bacterium]MDD3009917.1 single-stranded DNA-binding protein [Bacteroidales bacterium]MDD3960385.1 single-stranded DNA-binding protein [Bacteroidales bacterium]MDY0285491.1 single-stranded DNA-binding protein [Bacteroidales bacterium]